MEVDVKIEKTDVKTYTLSVLVDDVELKQWALENYPEAAEDEEEDPDWYKFFIDQYLETIDADTLFLDHCHDHANYDLESEECFFIEVAA